MGEQILRTYGTAGYERQLAHAMEILKRKERHDGISPIDRMAGELLRLFNSGRYTETHKVHGVKRTYSLLAAIPTYIPPLKNGVALDVKLHDPRGLNGGYLEGYTEKLLNAVRYDLLLKHFMQTAPDVARTALGGLCFTAGIVSRRQKGAFGLKLFEVARA